MAAPGSAIQSIIFKKQFWTVGRARKWLGSRGFTDTKVDVTNTQIRFRQRSPKDFVRFALGPPLKDNPSIRFLFGFTGRSPRS